MPLNLFGDARENQSGAKAAGGSTIDSRLASPKIAKNRRDSLNMGWQNDSLHGYGDYMQTHEFAKNLEELIRPASHEWIAGVCAQAVTCRERAGSQPLKRTWPRSYWRFRDE